MTLFEIKENMAQLFEQMVDPETGEIDDVLFQQFKDLEEAEDEKIDSWCFFLKTMRAEVDAAKKVSKDVKRHADAIENGFNSARERLAELLDGQKFKSANNSIYYSKTESVVLDQDVDVTDIDDEYLVYRKPDLNKDKIKAALKLGIEIPGVHLEQKMTMVVR